MKFIVTAQNMREIEKIAISQKLTSEPILINKASSAIVDYTTLVYPDTRWILVLAGPGTNGVDGMEAARKLRNAGRHVAVLVIAKKEKMSELAKTEFIRLQKKRIPIHLCQNMEDIEQYCFMILRSGLIIDALFGTGLSRNIEGVYKDIIDKINALPCDILSIDIPSGINSDDGKIMGTAFKANHTITFQYKKIGHYEYPGKEYCGNTVCYKLGLTSQSENEFLNYTKQIKYFDTQGTIKHLPHRKNNANKGSFKKVLMIVGSKNIYGAAFLSSAAALRSGAGLVKVLTDRTNRNAIATSLPEALFTTYSTNSIANDFTTFDKQSIEDAIAWSEVIVIGCGIGKDNYAKLLLQMALKNKKAIFVVDADAIELIKKEDFSNNQIIFTPHLKELSRFIDIPISEIQNNKSKIATDFNKKHKQILVMKDAVTYIATGNNNIYINTSGNSALAKAGSGDVLAGVIAGLLSIGIDPRYAAPLATYLHGLAGDIAKSKKGEHGVIARDVIQNLPNAFINSQQ